MHAKKLVRFHIPTGKVDKINEVLPTVKYFVNVNSASQCLRVDLPPVLS